MSIGSFILPSDNGGFPWPTTIDTSIQDLWVKPIDWIDISDVSVGKINLIVSDTSFCG